MRTYLDCIPCFVNEALKASRRVTDDGAVHERVLKAVLVKAAELSFSESPPRMGYEIHRIIRQETGNDDPYLEVKAHSNRLALSKYPDLRQQVLSSDDPFETALRLSIAGNILDFGVGSVSRENAAAQLADTIQDALTQPLRFDIVGLLRTAMAEASDILYIGDNAGEIVFDRLFIEQLPAEKITFVVKEGPVINDATRRDAEDAGLAKIVTVIDNGSRAPGTILELCSEEFRSRLEAADLLIAKGQANYETLSDVNKSVFFLLKAKCPVIARNIGCQVGDIVICPNRLHALWPIIENPLESHKFGSMSPIEKGADPRVKDLRQE
jgi:uncharacterized protein with ATP-grasp and redox domains